MNIGGISDIHMDINILKFPDFYDVFNEYVVSLNLDVLIIAGDIAGKNSAINEFLYRTSDLDIKKMYVPGNHCLWSNTKLSSWELYLHVLPEMCNKYNWHYLPHHPVVMGGVGFIGSPGWYDYSTRNKSYDEIVSFDDYKKKQWKNGIWQDLRFINFGKSDKVVTNMFLEQLEQDYFDLYGDSTERFFDKLVMVTHVVPYTDQVIHRGTLDWDYFSAFIGSEKVGKWFDEVEGYERKIAIYGHTHFPNHEVRENGVETYCVPFGYPHEHVGNNLKMQLQHSMKVIEL